MEKTHFFSIYLLKESISEKLFLKENFFEKGFQKYPNFVATLPKDAVLYIIDEQPIVPWWSSYFGIEEKLIQTLHRAIFVLYVNNRHFVFTFSYTSHYLKEDSFEYNFGLITTLNAVDPAKIKSTDIFQPGNTKRSRVQYAKVEELTYFDMHYDESIIKRLSGKVKEEYETLFSNITGGNNIRVSSQTSVHGLSDFCKQLLEIYKKKDYQKSFPNINNIVPIKDPALKAKLNKELVTEFNRLNENIILNYPDIINYSDDRFITYSGLGKRNKEKYEDFDIDNYRSYLGESNKTLVIEDLHKHKVILVDNNGTKKDNISIYKCLLFDYKHESKTYHLYDGNWYQIEQNYIKQLKTLLDPSFSERSKFPYLKECKKSKEADYNQQIAKDNESIICLDKKNIATKGNVEPCDLYTVTDKGIAVLIHIKISTKSALLSHLFNQGCVSITLLRKDDAVKKKLKQLLNDKEKKFTEPIDNNKFQIIFGIITHKEESKKSDNLPIFSRIIIRRLIKDLELMGIDGQVVFIKDTIDRIKRVK